MLRVIVGHRAGMFRSPEQVRHQRRIAAAGVVIGHGADRLVQPEHVVQHQQAGRAAVRGRAR